MNHKLTMINELPINIRIDFEVGAPYLSLHLGSDWNDEVLTRSLKRGRGGEWG